MADSIVPVLLLPEHIKLTPSRLPLLRAIQTLLNESYTKTYCARPEIFGTTHVRLAEPAQLADIVGDTGFTVILVRVPTVEDGKARIGEVIATGSVKDFGDGDVESYAQWSKNLGGREWAAKKRGQGLDDKGVEKERGAVRRFEVTAFGVAAHCQGAGLGAKVLQEIEWIVSSNAYGPRGQHVTDGTARAEGIELQTSETTSQLEGINLDTLKALRKNTNASGFRRDEHDIDRPKLVLMGIKELGNEAYYQRRGFKSVWTGTVPVGMWDCKKECNMVYMEKVV